MLPSCEDGLDALKKALQMANAAVLWGRIGCLKESSADGVEAWKPWLERWSGPGAGQALLAVPRAAAVLLGAPFVIKKFGNLWHP